MNLFRIIYYSERSSADLDLDQLLAISHKNNSRDGITGFLHHDGSSFLQVLEGSRRATSALYRRISADPRHTNLVLIGCCDVVERAFPSWSMGLHEGMDEPTKAIFRRYFATHEIDPHTAGAESLLRVLRDLASDSAERAMAALAASPVGAPAHENGAANPTGGFAIAQGLA